MGWFVKKSSFNWHAVGRLLTSTDRAKQSNYSWYSVTDSIINGVHLWWSHTRALIVPSRGHVCNYIANDFWKKKNVNYLAYLAQTLSICLVADIFFCSSGVTFARVTVWKVIVSHNTVITVTSFNIWKTSAINKIKKNLNIFKLLSWQEKRKKDIF